MSELICDLCGGDRFEPVVALSRQTALRSDRTVVRSRLQKAACRRCGLVRCADTLPSATIDAEYRDTYQTSLDEHVFYAPDGPRARSAVIADWLTSRLPSGVWTTDAAALEVGAGAGHLLADLRARFPNKNFVGVEPNVAAAREGARRGLDLRPSLEELSGSRAIDVAWSIAVIEHVQSPTAFLRGIRRTLGERGWLVLIQPTADVVSHDVLFVDHLHHFSGSHLAGYAVKCGFEQVDAAVGHPLMPNFSLHLWRTASAVRPFDWMGPPAVSCARTAATQTLDAMTRLDRLLDQLRANGRRVAAFGLHEVYAVAAAYSRLGAFPLVCGLDDQPTRNGVRDLPFPVCRPEDAFRFDVTDVLLTMNTVYYATAWRRCEALGLRPHAVLDEIR